jgi:hypothetical protein
MDLRLYYQKIREASTSIADPYPVVLSRETTDGGKEGIFTEVPRALAAKMFVDGIARMAKPAEAEAFHKKHAEAKRLAERVAAAARVQVTVLSPEELNTLRELSPSKG